MFLTILAVLFGLDLLLGAAGIVLEAHFAHKHEVDCINKGKTRKLCNRIAAL
jgi:hypothetical protein